MARQSIPRHKVSSGRLTCSGRGKPSKKNAVGRHGTLEPAYSLYSTDSEDQVTAVHKGLDRCAALLSGILQAEKTEFKSQSRVPKTTSSKPRSKLSSGKMEAERKRLGKKSSSVTHLAKRPTPVQKTILSAQSCPGLRGQPCFQDEQHPPAVDMVTRSEVKQPRLNPGTQTEHVQPHSVPLGCSVSDSRNGLSLTEQQTSTVFNCRLTTSTPALSPQTPTSVHSQVSHAGSGGETQHVTRHWAIATGPSGPHGSLKTAVPTAQYTASHSVAPAVQRYASVPAELPLASSVFSAPQAGSVGQSSPLHTQCGARTCHPPPTATPAPPPRPITSQPQVDPHPPLEHASSQEQQLSSGESSEDSGGCTSEEDELEGVDVMPVRDTSCQTSMDRHTVMLSQKNKLPSPEKTARKVKTVKYLLGELKTLVAHQDSEAVRLIAEVEESVSLLPAMVGSTNVQAELALALQPLRSENVQLRRRLRILNQQLQERERAERQARPVDCNLELVSLQSLNFTLQTQLNDSHRELGSLRQENQRLRQALEEKGNDLQHNREQCELETSRIRMDVHEALDEMRNCQAKFEHLERENGALTQSLHQKEAEITGLQEIIRDVGSTVEHCACTIPASYDGKSRHLQKSPTRNTACHFTQTEEPKPSSHLSRRVLDLHESQQEGNTVSSRVSESVQIYLQTLKGAGCAPEQSHALPQQLSPPSSDKWSATEDGCRLPEAQASSPKVLRVHRSAQHSAAKSWTQERGPRESHFVPPRETAAAAQKRFPVQPNGVNRVEGTNSHGGLKFLGLAFEKLGISNELPSQDLKVLDENKVRGFPSHSDRVGLQVTQTDEDAVDVLEQLQPARRCLWMGGDASVYTGQQPVFESTFSSCDIKSLASDCSVNSWSTFNTCKEKEFQNGLAALDASIANLQRTLKADLKI
ncbi:coiled-coil domain-containing protein 14 isoform X2 [Electrophorus electricus]|uniref:coiled-coil domain-containing protein 14 isoform X2 n=1 Tax=Electrophorus electricus TaxID=8005 RepID=UPI0015D09BE8|nr:coiled-coil domain-containing protein 14 isoform X2 [Electrophorus electricus]